MSSQASVHRLPLASRGFLKAYITTMRPYLLFVSGITGIVGMSFAAEIPTLQAILIFAASFLSYGFGQALTDCFQTDTDAISSPYRPLTQGIISKEQVLTISLAGLALCLVIFGYFYPGNIFLGILGALGLATYTFFKRRWWGGPLYNAWIVVVLFGMAFFAANGSVSVSIPVALTGISVLLGYANFVLSGYFKDIEADRQTGYMTLPVVYGRKVAARICDLFAVGMIVCGLAALPFYQVSAVYQIAPAIILLSGILVTLLAEVRLHRVNTDQEAHAAIGPVVHGYILFFGGIASALKPTWTIPLVCFYLLFVVSLKMRPARNQI
jgi:geranylgeranylglycerol-phosphate geranylgeranyltransferase